MACSAREPCRDSALEGPKLPHPVHHLVLCFVSGVARRRLRPERARYEKDLAVVFNPSPREWTPSHSKGKLETNKYLCVFGYPCREKGAGGAGRGGGGA